jgi:Uma2 family endonuclease
MKNMAMTTKLTFEEYAKLPELEGTRYELDEGTLVMTPSPTFRHNRIRERIARRLADFVEAHQSGEVTVETEFRLSNDTSRIPDVAFVTREHLGKIDIDRSPVNGAPAFAVEVISPANRLEDMARKVRQYLDAGCQAVWIIHPSLRRAEIHSKSGIQHLQEPQSLKEETLLPGFVLALSDIFG